MIEEHKLHAERYSRTSNFTVVNNKNYYDYRSYQTQEFHYHGSSSRSVSSSSWCGELEALERHNAWERHECDKTRLHRQQEQESRERFSAAAVKLLLVALPVVFLMALAQLSEEVSTVCFALCGVGTMFLIGILGGAFNLRDEDMEVAQDEARVPLSSTAARGMNYKDVVTAFEEAGFVDVRPTALYDLGFFRYHFGSSEGRVADVRIADVNDFEKGAILRKSS